MSPLPLPSLSRESCGSCSSCCYLIAVPELNKLENQLCKYEHNGCSIYKKRPFGCRNFRCEWLMSHEDVDKVPWPISLRPDNSHVIFAVAHMSVNGKIVECMGVHEEFKGATGSWPASVLIENMRDSGIVVVVKE